MPQPIFTPQGDDRNDYITIDGCIDWAVIPAHTLPRQRCDMPSEYESVMSYLG